MVSRNERQRLSILFDRQASHMRNQKESIDRLVSVNIIMSAALSEIADMTGPAHDVIDARQRASAALTECEQYAAAYAVAKGESTDSGEPTPSEENTDEGKA